MNNFKGCSKWQIAIFPYLVWLRDFMCERRKKMAEIDKYLNLKERDAHYGWIVRHTTS